MEKTYIIIPALEPESGLCGRIREMIRRIPAEIVVIDDGSGSDYREIFDKIADMMRIKEKVRLSKPASGM